MLQAFLWACVSSRIRTIAVLLGLSSFMLSSMARSDDLKWAKRLPKEAAIVWHYGGSESQREAFEKTANFDAFYHSGLVAGFQKVWSVRPLEGMLFQPASGDDQLTTKHIVEVSRQLYQHGFTMSVCLPEDDQGSWPYGLFIIPDAAEHAPSIGAWADALAKSSLAKRASAPVENISDKVVSEDDDKPNEGVPNDFVKDRTDLMQLLATDPVIGYETIGFKDRTIYCLHSRWGTAKMDWACWSEGRNLMVYFGRPGVTAIIDKAAAEGSVATSQSWQRAWPKLDQPIAETSRAWCDVARLLKRYGPTPIPEQPIEFTIAKLLKPLGFDEIESIAWRTGYHNRHLVDVWDVVTPQPRKGLLALYDQPTVSLDRLPPLPASLRSFSIQPFDAAFRCGTNLGSVRRDTGRVQLDAAAGGGRFLSPIRSGIQSRKCRCCAARIVCAVRKRTLHLGRFRARGHESGAV